MVSGTLFRDSMPSLHTFLNIHTRLRRRIRFAYFHTVHRLSERAIRRWQGARLRKLIRHAHKNVQLWRDLLGEAGLDIEELRGLDRLKDIPVTKKETFAGRPVEEYVDTSRHIFAKWKTTSGTSGKPFTFLPGYEATNSHLIDFACYRFLYWNGLPLGEFATTKVARIKIRSKSSTYRKFVPVANFQSDPEKVYRELAEYKPVILDAYASILIDLARMASWNILPILRIPYVVSFGEMLSPSSRHFIEKHLGCEVYNRYGTEEMGVIGLECAVHDGFHVHSESNIVEITDDSYTPVPAGQYGRIIATNLLNYNMPFIRYDTGDHGFMDSEVCPCGLKTPRIWVEGRYSAYLTFGAGRRIHHLEFDAALDGFMNTILQYQVAKKSETEVEIRIIPGMVFGPEARERVEKSIRTLVGDGITVSISAVPTLSRTTRGKSEIVVDETTG